MFVSFISNIFLFLPNRTFNKVLEVPSTTPCYTRPAFWLSPWWCPSLTWCCPVCSVWQPGWRTTSRPLYAHLLPSAGTSRASEWAWCLSLRADRRVCNMFALGVSRNLMLKFSVLGVLCYHWLGRVAADPQIIGLKVTWDTRRSPYVHTPLCLDEFQWFYKWG